MPEVAATRGQHAHAVADPLDGAAVRADFPVLNQPPVEGRPPLVFLDSAASSQKPAVVIDALTDYYTRYNANIHRGVYELSEIATERYEAARKTVARFINARSARECIFVRNTTEAINLVAQSWGRANLRPGDLIVGTVMEHHSNLVPWQLVAAATGARLAHVRMTADGRLDLDHFDVLMTEEPKLVALAHVSNSLGTVHPVKELIARAHAVGATTLIDGAQSVPHLQTDVRDLDCDFLAFSGHKMCGPMGASVLYGKKALLDAMPPFLGGGSMIRKVELDGSTWADVPAKFEAGTPAVGDAIALAVAVGYLDGLGMERVWAHEREVVDYALERLREVEDVMLFGPRTAEARSGVVSFAVGDIHPHDVAAILDEGNVAVRAGHHCTQPLMRALGVVATTRASFYVYNTLEDVDRLVDGLHRVNRVLGGKRSVAPSAARADEPCRAQWEQADGGAKVPAEVPDVG
ncbi:MAG: cysteine desulfurase [Chloroflexia bacterium]|nr:cysteine desulfurase [Chloroflexia bacterium]